MPYIQFEKIQIGQVTIYVWGLFLVLGIIFILLYTLNKTKKSGIDSDLILSVFPWLLVGMIMGSRLVYILDYLDYYLSNPIEIFKIWQGGLSSFGGLAGILLSGIIFAKIKKVSLKLFLKTADIIVLSVPLGIAIGRIGCSLINDHQGIQTSLPWAIVWPDGALRHPTAEYLILGNLIIFLILYFSKPKKTGQLFFRFLVLYSIMRFFLDFTRFGDTLYFSLSTAQWLSLAVILGIIVKKLLKGHFYQLNKQ